MDKPLLMEAEELTPIERVNLSQLRTHPGFPVLEKLLATACKRATEAVVKLDPMDEGFERKLKALQQKARERNEFSMLVLASIEWQDQYVKSMEEVAGEKVNPESAQNPILKAAQRK